MTGVRGGEAARTPGEFRRSQNWIGGPTPQTARFVPPPVEDMHRCLHELESFLHDGSGLPTLIRVGLAHAQFETIHPFLDGNGRVGRRRGMCGVESASIALIATCQSRATWETDICLSTFLPDR